MDRVRVGRVLVVALLTNELVGTALGAYLCSTHQAPPDRECLPPLSALQSVVIQSMVLVHALHAPPQPAAMPAHAQ
jgi:hypothetical protein